MKLKNILTGWAKKLGLLPVAEAEAAMSALRLRICKACPEAKVSPIMKFFGDDTAELVDTMVCTRCSCPCEPKSLVVNESCPLKLW